MNSTASVPAPNRSSLEAGEPHSDFWNGGRCAVDGRRLDSVLDVDHEGGGG